jgi:hypothetical protein
MHGPTARAATGPCCAEALLGFSRAPPPALRARAPAVAREDRSAVHRLSHSSPFASHAGAEATPKCAARPAHSSGLPLQGSLDGHSIHIGCTVHGAVPGNPG